MPSYKYLQKIHIAVRDLGLADDVYRDILWQKFRKRSSKDLTTVQSGRLIEHFKQLGWQPKNKSKQPDATIPYDGQSRKILALWITLFKAGAVQNGSNKALLRVVERTVKVNRLEWCSADQKNKVIEALKDWGKREGVEFG